MYSYNYPMPNSQNNQNISNQYNGIMQQLQGQIQAINDRMSQIQTQFQTQYPQLFQQPQQQQQPPQAQQVQSDVISCIPVTSYDEVKGQTPLPVGKRLFTNFKKGELFTVYFDKDDNKIIDKYCLQVETTENEPAKEYATRNDIAQLLNYIETLENKINSLEGMSNDARANYEDYSEQPTNRATVPATTKASKPRSSSKPDDGK